MQLDTVPHQTVASKEEIHQICCAGKHPYAIFTLSRKKLGNSRIDLLFPGRH
jgi:hypothetical protein